MTAGEGSAGLVGHGVHDAQQSVGESHAGQALRVVHPVAGFHIAVVGLLQIVVDHLDGMQSQGIGVVAVHGGHIGLDGMGHGVHTGVSGQLGRHLLSQIGVNDGHVGSDVEVGQRILDALVVVGDNREGGHLGSGTGGGGNGAEMSLLTQGGEVEGNAQVLEGHIGVLIESPHGLGSVDGAAAADGNDPVGLKAAHSLGAAHNGGHAGIGLHTFKQMHFHAGLFQVGNHAVQETKPLHAAAAGDNKSLFAFQIFQLVDRAFAMVQVTGKSETHNHCLHILLPKGRKSDLAADVLAHRKYVKTLTTCSVIIISFIFAFG